MNSFCKVDLRRCCERLIRSYVPLCSFLPGDMAELGVYRGDSAELIHSMAPFKTLHLFDTFAGIPASEVTPSDDHRPGDFKASIDCVRERFKGKNKIRFHQGIFPGTAFDVSLCFFHIDCDIGKTAEAALQWGWRNLVPNGVMLIDDYGFGRCRYLKSRCDAFCKNITGTYKVIGQRLVIQNDRSDYPCPVG